MMTFLQALLPVFVLVAVGYIFQYYNFPGGDFWTQAARITYFAFFPALLVNRLATAPLEGIDILPLILALSLPVVTVTLVLIALKPVWSISNPAFTSVVQGSIRFNTYVGLAIAAALFGAIGVATTAIALAILIPLVNVVCVAVLTHYVASQSFQIQKVLRSIAMNPLIIACVLGIGVNSSGIGLPSGVQEILEIFGRAALPMGLLTVGAGLELSAVRASLAPVLLASGVKLLILPCLTMLACSVFGVSGTTAIIAIMLAALPTAPSAYILAQELGGDTTLMASILTIQTGLAFATMPLIAAFW